MQKYMKDGKPYMKFIGLLKDTYQIPLSISRWSIYQRHWKTCGLFF
ncbi:MAG: hypothetical protein M9892_05500 [Bacteroidetes bacterium]|nr:hypothetical protein [Bacteroidota bacterium]